MANLKRWGAIALALHCVACTADPRPRPLPQDPDLRVYFNHNASRGADYREPDRAIRRPGDNLEAILLQEIRGAKTSIAIAVQELRLPRIAAALVDQQTKGVRVRLVLEHEYNTSPKSLDSQAIAALDGENQGRYRETLLQLDRNQNRHIEPEELAQGDALTLLTLGKIPRIDDREDGSKGSGLMHHKFMVIDEKRVVTGSANWTTSDIHGDWGDRETRGNANNLLVINSVAVAQVFLGEFNLLWGDGPGGKKNSQFGTNKPRRSPVTLPLGRGHITLHFSPQASGDPWPESSNGLIDRTLRQGQQNIDLALFVFSEQLIADGLQDRQHQGVIIRALIDPRFAFRPYSEGLDLLGIALPEKCRYEPGNRPWSVPLTTVGVPSLVPGDKLHHKFAVIDRRWVITGSHNWSAAANGENDETLLIFDHPPLAAHYQREFDRLYQFAQVGIVDSLKQQQQQAIAACDHSVTQRSRAVITGIVNLNQASFETLVALPGIGPSTASQIINARNQAPITSLEDLDQRVKGIGPKTVALLRGTVTW